MSTAKQLHKEIKESRFRRAKEDMRRYAYTPKQYEKQCAKALKDSTMFGYCLFSLFFLGICVQAAFGAWFLYHIGLLVYFMFHIF